jgi:hypothetical protein
MSQRKAQNTINHLELRRLVKRIGSKLGGESGGNYYQVLIPESVPTGNPNIPPDKVFTPKDFLDPGIHKKVQQNLVPFSQRRENSPLVAQCPRISGIWQIIECSGKSGLRLPLRRTERHSDCLPSWMLFDLYLWVYVPILP